MLIRRTSAITATDGPLDQMSSPANELAGMYLQSLQSVLWDVAVPASTRPAAWIEHAVCTYRQDEFLRVCLSLARLACPWIRAGPATAPLSPAYWWC